MSAQLHKLLTIFIGPVARGLILAGVLVFLVWLFDRHVAFGSRFSVPFRSNGTSPYVRLHLPNRRPVLHRLSAENALVLEEGRLDITLEPPRTFQIVDISFTANSCAEAVFSSPAPFGTELARERKFRANDETGPPCSGGEISVRIPLDEIGNDRGTYHLALKSGQAAEPVSLTSITVQFEGEPLSWKKILHGLSR